MGTSPSSASVTVMYDLSSNALRDFHPSPVKVPQSRHAGTFGTSVSVLSHLKMVVYSGSAQSHVSLKQAVLLRKCGAMLF